MENAKIGDKIKIINMKGERHYTGREGYVRNIDSMGYLHGSWGGCAILPNEDEYEIMKGEK